MKHLLPIAIVSISLPIFGNDNMNEYILTPPPTLAPRINGAKVVGARPGNPFLFKVPATGEKPLLYLAGSLPLGLTRKSEITRTPVFRPLAWFN